MLLANDPCLIIAEVGNSHDGSLGTAHAYIDAAARAGADAVKFQTHIAAAESSAAEPWRVRFSPQDATRYDYWKRMEFSEEQWTGLARHASECGLLFLSSPFSIEAGRLLLRAGVGAWKIASGELTNIPMIEYLAESGLPFLISTGMSGWEDIDRVVAMVRARRLQYAVLQCTSAYPCPPERIGLNLLAEYRERFQCPVGLSDHSGKIYPSLAAVTLGAKVLEVHITFSHECFGPDTPASLTMQEFRQLVDGVRFIECMQANPVDKEAAASAMAPMRALFTKSLVAVSDLNAGTVLCREHLGARKPGMGIPAADLPEVLGQVLLRTVRAGEFLGQEDIARPVVLLATAS
ncbi:MAG: N-acetylneuraminate synthase family protein [Bryobacterales bacterium]|nr:N-acetylneuraminate synthase family protein [Bryobacterales bacterium]